MNDYRFEASLMMLLMITIGGGTYLALSDKSPPDGLRRLNPENAPIGVYLDEATGCEWSGRSPASLTQHLDTDGKPICDTRP